MDLDGVRSAGKDINLSLLANDFPRIVNILETIEKKFQPTTDSIKSTGIGLLVGKLRKSTNPQVATTAHRIINSWKTAVKSSGGVSGSSTPVREASSSSSTNNITSAKASTALASTSSSSSLNPSRSATNNIKSAPPSPSKLITTDTKRTGKSDKVDFEITGDKTRNTCLSLIYDSLVSDATAPVEQVLSVASEIEKLTLENQGKGTPGNDYRNRMRSLVLNLGKINVELRHAVVEGRLRPAKLCSMTVVEMASKDRKNENLELEKQSIIDAQVAKPVESETDQFKCGKCNERRTSFYQMQTRSADEPMTVCIYEISRIVLKT